ncbi:MAG TPA: von Willebrand factor type A domain-containing protein, partial [Pyrinomonadaceae bacterium]
MKKPASKTSRLSWLRGRFASKNDTRFLISLVLAACVLAASCARSNKQGGEADGPIGVAENRSGQPSASANPSGTFGRQIVDEGEEQAKRRKGESYGVIDENPFLEAARAPLSTFSIDVDTASYSNVRRFLNDGQLPPKDAVRVEELINYFSYDYPQPAGATPFSVTTEVADCPWDTRHRLVHIGLQGRRVASENLPPANLVFLVDVSGSMQPANRLPLVKTSLRML